MIAALFVETDKGDQRCRMLADRHYTRQKIGDRQWTRPGYNQVLYFSDRVGAAVFVWWRPKYEAGVERRDGMRAIECTIFRNESGALSSDLVIDACAALQSWERFSRDLAIITGVDSTATASRRGKNSRPGECFRRAGFVDMPLRQAFRKRRGVRCDTWLVLPAGNLPTPRRAAMEPRGQLSVIDARTATDAA